MERRKIRKKKEDYEYIPDDFDKSILLDVETDICVFCKGGHFTGIDLGNKLRFSKEIDDIDEDLEDSKLDDLIQEEELVWASKYSLSSGKRTFAHFYCAFFSPQTWYQGGQWFNLRKEVARSTLLCRICKKRGATLGCFESRCHYVAHIPCALTVGFSPHRGLSVFNKFQCPEHRVILKEKFDPQILNDISNGREIIPIPFVNEFDAMPYPSGFKYIMSNLDSDEVQSLPSNVNSISCCTCQDLCIDPKKCACLRGNRSYSFRGGLLEGVEGPLTECGMRCNCSIRRCTNRVVGRGPQVRLEVFRKPPPIGLSESIESISSNRESFDRISSSSSVQGWGVRVGEDVPSGTFICEFIGQYIPGSGRDYSSLDSSCFPSPLHTSFPSKRKTDETEAGEVGLELVRSFNEWSEGMVAGKKFKVQSLAPTPEPVSLCLDARKFGNVSRFIKRHSGCPPNLELKVVYSEGPLPSNCAPRLAFFAAHALPAHTELLT